MKTLLSLLTMFAIQAALPPTISRTTVEGTVTRAGSSDPIAGAQVTLTVGFPAERIASVAGGVSAMGVQAANFQTVSSQLLTMNPQDLQATINAFRAQGLPPGILAAVEGMHALMKATPDLPLKTVSDGHGRFAFRDLPPGRYTLVVQREGYFAPSPNGAPPLPQASILPVVIPEQPMPQHLSMMLVPGGLISGRVRDANGSPALNATVQAYIVEYQDGQPVLLQAASKQTDDRGEFRLAWVQPGAYIVSATPRPTTTPGVEVAVRTFYPNAVESTGAVPVVVNPGNEVGGIDISVRTVRPVTVSGQVVSSLSANESSGDGVPETATLVLVRRDPTTAENPRIVGTVGLTPTVGAFEIHDILPGTYDLFARIQSPNGSPGGPGLPSFAWGRAALEVDHRNLENVTISVYESVDVRGVVTIDGQVPPTGSGLRVGLQAAGSSARIGNYQAIEGRQQAPAPDGAFTVPSVAEGPYRVIVSGGAPDAYIADIRQRASSIFDAGLYVTSKPPDPVEVVVRTDGGSVEGTLVQSRSEPVGRTLVVLIPPGPRRQNPLLYRTTLSNPQGQFTFRGVPPGSYKAFAWHSLPDGAYLNADFVKAHENEGLAVEVAPGRTVGATVRLIENTK